MAYHAIFFFIIVPLSNVGKFPTQGVSMQCARSWLEPKYCFVNLCARAKFVISLKTLFSVMEERKFKVLGESGGPDTVRRVTCRVPLVSIPRTVTQCKSTCTRTLIMRGTVSSVLESSTEHRGWWRLAQYSP